MRLYIVRHGETPWNTERRLQGQTDIALNENGRSLAGVTARALQKVPFDLAVTSPLSRAVETAEIIIGTRKIPLIPEPRIQEISFGEREGKRMTDEERDHPGSDFYQFFHEPQNYQPGRGGETIDALCARTGAFLDELKEKKEWQDSTILISSHGAAVRAMQSHMTGCSRSSFWGSGVPKNCAVTIVELENGSWIIKEQDVVYYENL